MEFRARTATATNEEFDEQQKSLIDFIDSTIQLKKKKYRLVSDLTRSKLLKLIQGGLSIKKAAKKLRINYSTAKAICKNKKFSLERKASSDAQSKDIMKSEEKEEEIGGKFCPSERKANKNRSQASTGKRMEPEKNNNAQADYHLIKEEEKESEAQGRLIPPTASSFSTGPTIQSSAESMLFLTNGQNIYNLQGGPQTNYFNNFAPVFINPLPQSFLGLPNILMKEHPIGKSNPSAFEAVLNLQRCLIPEKADIVNQNMRNIGDLDTHKMDDLAREAFANANTNSV